MLEIFVPLAETPIPGLTASTGPTQRAEKKTPTAMVRNRPNAEINTQIDFSIKLTWFELQYTA
jgi:hypothetical protein